MQIGKIMSEVFVERLLKVSEVMDRTSLSRSSLYKLVSENKISHVRIGRSVRFRESEVRRFIEELAVSA
jgi:excisionase family DNA binding protein